MVVGSLSSGSQVIDLAAILFAVVVLLTLIAAVLAVASVLRRRPVLPAYLPRLTVVVPCHDEAENIERCVEAILASDYPRARFDVICVDDGSTDATPDLLARLARAHPCVRILCTDHGGKAGALNQAVSLARGEVVVTIDGDTFVAPGFLRAIVAPLGDARVGAAHGIGLVDQPRSVVERFQEVEYALINLLRWSFAHTLGECLWFSGPAAAFRAEAVRAVGGFATDTLTEDLDMAMRLLASGRRVVVTDRAHYTTKGCASALELLRQRLRWAAGTWQCVVRFRRLVRWSPTMAYFYVNHVFYSLFAWIVFPLTAYEMAYWWPHGILAAATYVVRWFSTAGLVYFVWKIPEWGVTPTAGLAVGAGLASNALLLGSLWRFRLRPTAARILTVVFFYPYSLLLDLALAGALVLFLRDRHARFIARSRHGARSISAAPS